MTFEQVDQALRRLGVEVKPPTFRRWSSEGTIPKPRRYANPVGRGRLSDWPEETVEEAAANWAVRRLKSWVPAGKESVRRVRELAGQLRESELARLSLMGFAYFRNGVRESAGIRDDDIALRPLVVAWILAVEKARHGWAIERPAHVILGPRGSTIEEAPDDKLTW